MPPAHFCSISVPSGTEKKFKKLRARLGAGDITKLAVGLVPEEFRKTGKVTNGVLLEIAFRAIEEQLGKGG